MVGISTTPATLPPLTRYNCTCSTRLVRGGESDHNQILGQWYALYAGWSDAPLRGEWVKAPEP
eukprot:4953966-Pleurochrysis_carterae.AAC.1